MRNVMGKVPESQTRCTFEENGEVCDHFPSWEVGKRERRCEHHMKSWRESTTAEGVAE
jgi:hypothetical protein